MNDSGWSWQQPPTPPPSPPTQSWPPPTNFETPPPWVALNTLSTTKPQRSIWPIVVIASVTIVTILTLAGIIAVTLLTRGDGNGGGEIRRGNADAVMEETWAELDPSEQDDVCLRIAGFDTPDEAADALTEGDPTLDHELAVQFVNWLYTNAC